MGFDISKLAKEFKETINWMLCQSVINVILIMCVFMPLQRNRGKESGYS